MAKPIELMPTPPNARDELKRRLDEAPVEHAEAVLAGYEVLQQLHESGTLDVLRGLLGAGDQVVRHAVGLAIQPEAVDALRNLLVLSKVLSSVNPDVLHRVLAGLPEALAQRPEEDPPSLFAIFRRMSSKDSRRSLAAAVTVLEKAGKGLESK
ncbi:MAG: hypothetical protein WAK33_02325 [Silvibacterium sp.]